MVDRRDTLKALAGLMGGYVLWHLDPAGTANAAVQQKAAGQVASPLLEHLVHGNSAYAQTTGLPDTGMLRAYAVDKLDTVSEEDFIPAELHIFSVSPKNAHIVAYSVEDKRLDLSDAVSAPMSVDLTVNNACFPEKDPSTLSFSRLDEFNVTNLVAPGDVDFLRLAFARAGGQPVEFLNNLANSQKRAFVTAGDSRQYAFGRESTGSPHIASDYWNAMIGTLSSGGRGNIITVEPQRVACEGCADQLFDRTYLIKNFRVGMDNQAYLVMGARLNLNYESARLKPGQAFLEVIPDMSSQGTADARIAFGGVQRADGAFVPLYEVNQRRDTAIVDVNNLAAVVAGRYSVSGTNTQPGLLPRVGYNRLMP